MLKAYRIIPLVFILFLFGFTLITVAPVFAQSWEPSMGMRHPDRPCMKSNMCGEDSRSNHVIESDPHDTNNPVSQAARANQPDSSTPAVAPTPSIASTTSPSGGEVAQLNARIAELEAKNAKLLAQQGAPADPTKMVRQRDERIHELSKYLKRWFSVENRLDCEKEVLRQRDTREWWHACVSAAQTGRPSLICEEQRKLVSTCTARIGEEFEEWREKFRTQLSRIQHYFPIEGEANKIECSTC